MWPAVPTIMRGSAGGGRKIEMRELGDECVFVVRVEAAENEPERLVRDAAEDRSRQRAQRRVEAGEAAALASLRTHGDAVTRQTIDRQRAAADLAGHRLSRRLVGVA